MKLHLSAEDVSLYLQDHSARAMQRIPAAAKELLRIQVSVSGLALTSSGSNPLWVLRPCLTPANGWQYTFV